MDTKKRKEEIQTKFNQATQQREQLSVMIEQLRGQYSLLDEMSKEDEKEETQGKKNDKVDTATK